MTDDSGQNPADSVRSDEPVKQVDETIDLGSTDSVPVEDNGAEAVEVPPGITEEPKDTYSSPLNPTLENKPPLPRAPLISKPVFGTVAAVVLAVAFGFAAAWLKEGRSGGTAPVPVSQPEIFVAEEVLETERADLAAFAETWQAAVEKKLSFDEYKQLALGPAGRFKNMAIVKVGEETLYGNDLNYLALFYGFKDYTAGSRMPTVTINRILDEAMTDSVLLQEAFKQGLLEPEGSFYNSADKNYRLRNEMVETARLLLGNKLVQKISGEAVAIWFNNNTVPVGAAEGKQLAFTKIEKLYRQLQSGEIDFEQAGKLIDADAEIGKKIDPDWRANSHYVFEGVEKGKGPFNFESLNQELWGLGEGQMSGILIGKKTVDGQETEYMYIILKVNKRSGESGPESTEEMEKQFLQGAVKEDLGL